MKNKLPPHLQKSVDALERFLKETPKKELDALIKKYTRKKIKKGWIDIEKHLPMVTGNDLIKNNAMIKFVKVKNKKGKEWESQVGDHNIWYYIVKEAGVTHWWNE